MKVRNALFAAIYLTGTMFLLCDVAHAQFVFERNTGQMAKPASTPEPTVQTRSGDQLIRTQPASEEQQRAQGRRTDDQINQTPQQERAVERPRIPDSIERQTPKFPDAQRPMKGPPYVFASPSLVRVKPGENFGYTAIIWDAGPNHPYAEVWRQVDGGTAEFMIEKGSGQTGAKIELGKTYTFKLSDFGETLDAVTVTATQELAEMPGGVIKRPGRDVEGNMVTYVTDVKTESRNNGVMIGFFAPGNSSPSVEVGSTAPRVVGGRYAFSAGSLLSGGSAVPSSNIKKVGVKANTYHKVDLNSSLDPGTQYWYIITGQNPGGEPNIFQTTGSLTTASQTVRVVFEKVRVIDDSDDLSEGEIRFWGWINEGLPGEQGWENGRSGMSSGETYDLGKEFTIKNAPNLFKISVSANDDDNTFTHFDNGAIPSPIYGFFNEKNSFDGNGAWQEWDLSSFPTAYRHAFTLKSRGGEAKLQFEVTGYWEITRSK